MKNKKSIISIVIALVAIIGSIVFASDVKAKSATYTYSKDGYTYQLNRSWYGTNNQAYITAYTGTDENPTFVKEIVYNNEKYPVIAIESDAFSNNSNVKKLVIPAEIVSIHRGSFSNMPNLEEIDISKYTRNVISGDTFANNPKLKKVRVSAANIFYNDPFTNSPLVELYIYYKNLETSIPANYIEQYAISHNIPYVKLYDTDWIVETLEGNKYFVKHSKETGIEEERRLFSEPVVTGIGLKINVTNTMGVKTIRYAYGDYQTVRAMKNSTNYGVVRGQNTTGEITSFNVKNEGLYTVYVEYVDGSKYFYKTNTVKKVPSYNVSNASVEIGNLDNVRIIRYVLGNFNTASQIKAQSNDRYVLGTSINSNTYNLLLAKNGTYTILIEYLDGTSYVEHITLNNAQPDVAVNGRTITVSNLDNTRIVRWVKGNYSTPRDIKAQTNDRYVKGDTLTTDSYNIRVNDSGVYTIFVEYNNLLQYYFHVTVE